MKYKRLLSCVTVLLFIVIAVLCCNFLFKISDVQLSVTYIENSPENINEKVSEYSKTLEGKNLLFVNEKDIEKEVLAISPYANVIKVEKVFPCSIKITVTEFEEIFSLKCGDKYYMLDSSLRVLCQKENNLNNVTTKPNLSIIIDESDYQPLVVGDKLNFLDKTTNDYLLELTPLINGFKENITNFSINVVKDGIFNRTLTLTTVEGLVVQFDKINVQTVDKFEFFKSWYSLQETVKEGKYYITVDKNSNQIIVTT